MPNRTLTPLGLASIALSVAAGAPAAQADTNPSTGTLTILADGFQSNRGHAFARLYRPGDKVTGTPWRLIRADIAGNKARFEATDLPFGDYAVVVHHDENDNGVIDHNLLGLPSEPLGFSNGFQLSLVSGRPTFDKLRFTFRAETAPLRVTVR
jgi:uncharacterized protein (DUF2141 family)